jgi:hypothetical protein
MTEIIFTSTSLRDGVVITASMTDGIITIAHDGESVPLRLEDALDVTAEIIRYVLDDNKINHHGVTLGDWLGDDDACSLRYLLSRITGPEGPTFTNPAGTS